MSAIDRQYLSLPAQLISILNAMPGFGVVVYRDGQDFKAALVDRPPPSAFNATACRSLPEDAVDELHRGLVADAQARFEIARDHLGRLMFKVGPGTDVRSGTGPETEGGGT